MRSTRENGGAEVGIGSAVGPGPGPGLGSVSASAGAGAGAGVLGVRLDWKLGRKEKRRIVAAVIAEAAIVR